MSTAEDKDLKQFIKESTQFIMRKKGMKILGELENLMNKYHEINDKHDRTDLDSIIEDIILDLCSVSELVEKELEL